MDNSSAVFFIVCGVIVGWVAFWAVVSHMSKQRLSNAPPGSRAKKVMDFIGFMQILPLLPIIPIVLLWMLLVKLPITTLYRWRKGKREVFKLRRRWEETRKEWAVSDLENARSEKTRMFLVEDAEVERERSSSLPGKSTQISAEIRRAWFESLPAELRMEIYSYLDYGEFLHGLEDDLIHMAVERCLTRLKLLSLSSIRLCSSDPLTLNFFVLGMALRLKSVNKFFWYDKPEETIDREQRATFIYHMDTFQHNRRAGRLACYTCLRLRGKNEFSEDQRTGDFKRFGVQETERRCFDCQVAQREVTWTKRLIRRMNQLEKRIWVRAARLFRRDLEAPG